MSQQLRFLNFLACPTPEDVDNAMRVPDKSMYLAGEMLSYQCNGLLVFFDNTVVSESTCQYTGGADLSWSLSMANTNLPTCCKFKYCNK